MTNKETSERAFPSNRDMRNSPDWDYEPGLTLRDYFAAKAMTGCLPGSAFSTGELQLKAQRAYRMADAMLEARK